MADNTYHLYVHLEGDGEKKKDSVVAGQKKSTSSAPKTKGGKEGEGLTGKQVAGKVISYAATAYKLADTIISYQVSQVNLQTGAAEYQQKLQFQQHVAKKAIGSVGGAIIGAVMTGNIAAAVIGFATYALYDGINYTQRLNTLRTEQNVEDIGRGFMNIRAGVSGSRSRRE